MSPWIAAPPMGCDRVRDGGNEIGLALDLDLGEFEKIDHSEVLVLDEASHGQNGRIVLTANIPPPKAASPAPNGASSST